MCLVGPTYQISPLWFGYRMLFSDKERPTARVPEKCPQLFDSSLPDDVDDVRHTVRQAHCHLPSSPGLSSRISTDGVKCLHCGRYFRSHRPLRFGPQSKIARFILLEETVGSNFQIAVSLWLWSMNRLGPGWPVRGCPVLNIERREWRCYAK